MVRIINLDAENAGTVLFIAIQFKTQPDCAVYPEQKGRNHGIMCQ
jgi:hypothetical protein